MARGGKPNFIRLRIEVISVPTGITREMIKLVLLASIRKGHYRLPDEWIIKLCWTNSREREMKCDEWENAMSESAASSRGWDSIVREYIEERI